MPNPTYVPLLSSSTTGDFTIGGNLTVTGTITDSGAGTFASVTVNPGPLTVTGNEVISGNIASQPATSGSTILSSNVAAGDAFDRMRITGAGNITIGSGSAARDVTLGRTAANTLGLTNTDLDIVTAGRGVKVAEGANAKMGTSVLVAGSVVVANTSVTANSRIFVTSQVDGGTPGFLRVSTRTAGTSFTITSSNGADTSTVAWIMVEPG